jgi:hypothetical protein
VSDMIVSDLGTLVRFAPGANAGET